MQDSRYNCQCIQHAQTQHTMAFPPSSAKLHSLQTLCTKQQAHCQGSIRHMLPRQQNTVAPTVSSNHSQVQTTQPNSAKIQHTGSRQQTVNHSSINSTWYRCARHSTPVEQDSHAVIQTCRSKTQQLHQLIVQSHPNMPSHTGS